MMQYAIVTGATQGIGKAITEKLLSEGFSVAICARSTQKLESVAAVWKEKYPLAAVITYTADISVREQVIGFADAVIAQFPAIDLLVNNAGAFLAGDIADEPEGRLGEILAVNLFGAYHLTRRIVPLMKKNSSGHIVNICSVAGLQPYPGSGAYSISKYALVGFSQNLREELKQFGIKVTTICPGATDTSSWEGSGVDPARLMSVGDVAVMVWSAHSLSPRAGADTIILRPLRDAS